NSRYLRLARPPIPRPGSSPMSAAPEGLAVSAGAMLTGIAVRQVREQSVPGAKATKSLVADHDPEWGISEAPRSAWSPSSQGPPPSEIPEAAASFLSERALLPAAAFPAAQVRIAPSNFSCQSRPPFSLLKREGKSTDRACDAAKPGQTVDRDEPHAPIH